MTDQTVMLFLVLGVIGGLFAVVLVYLHQDEQRRIAEVTRQAETAQALREKEARAREREARAKEAARIEMLDRFKEFVNDPANGSALLATDGAWRRRFDWAALQAAAQEEAVSLSAMQTRAVIVAFRAAQQASRVTPDACIVLARELARAERGQTPELDRMLDWFRRFAARQPAMMQQAADQVRAGLKENEARQQEISEWYWLTGETQEAGNARRLREWSELNQAALEILESKGCQRG